MSNKKISTKPISINPMLKDYLDETLKLEKIRKMRKIEGARLGVREKLSIRNNDEMKVRAIDAVFRSLANLIYFFEYLNEHPELIDKFGEDIEELFGFKVTKDPKLNTFRRFIESILGHRNRYGSKAMSDPKFNYQRRLLTLMQSAIHRTAWGYFMISQEGGNFREMFHTDLTRAEVWTKYIDRSVPHERKKSRRSLAF